MTACAPTRSRRLAVGAAACATAAAVVAGSVTTGVGDAGALVIGSGTEQSILGGNSVAVGLFGGKATSVAVLPLSFAGTYADGSYSSTAFALLGVAAGTAHKPILFEPEFGDILCLGGLAFASSSVAGSCINVLGVVGAQYDKPGQNLQFALTNPLALLTGDIGLGDVLSGIVSGNLNTAISADFVHLTVGGTDWQSLVRLTSTYGFQKISNAYPGAIAIEWMGTKVLLFPTTQLNGNTYVNYLGLPRVEFGLPTGIGSIIPSIRTGAFALPFDITIPGIDTSDLLPLQTPSAATAARAGVVDDGQARTFGGPDLGADDNDRPGTSGDDAGGIGDLAGDDTSTTTTAISGGTGLGGDPTGQRGPDSAITTPPPSATTEDADQPEGTGPADTVTTELGAIE